MNWKPLFGIVIVLSLLLQLKQCRYGAEHQEVAPPYRGAHLAAVNGQKLLQEKKTVEALRFYELARAELEHENVQGHLGRDEYINYGFVLNDIGVIRLAWALYGREPDPSQSSIDPDKIDREELALALGALQEAVAFYLRWHANNPAAYERFAKAISESYANLGTALKYHGDPQAAEQALADALRYHPKNGNALRGLELLRIDPAPYVLQGEARWREHERKGPF